MEQVRNGGNERENIPNKLRPVVDARRHVAGEDKVERRRVHPRVLDVVDLELDVGWRERDLVGAEVVADDLGGVRTKSSG